LDEHQLQLIGLCSEEDYVVLPALKLSTRSALTYDYIAWPQLPTFHKFNKQDKFIITFIKDMQQGNLVATADIELCGSNALHFN
jgi:hypothetical protein